MPVLLPTAKVLELCHPLLTSPWGAGRVSEKMVHRALASNQFSPVPVEHGARAEEHAARIAFLMQNGWSDSIEIDVGVPSLGCWVDWPVLDGNHRLAAASLRGDAEILATVSGSLDYAMELFGMNCEEK
jgi:hypothetical protein